ncbi:ABC transporter, permease protein [Streptococcus sp. DD11]|uniref:YfhO family protein n=1 Tax=Streptococcus sp. DD11 TaxID=1777879 RepID=UPI0007916345|nr:YfhO family protein [Streptococcus sp. DD11]KXT84918.1 ABC transporter, permease protein [Streptococcus sp. DD11]
MNKIEHYLKKNWAYLSSFILPFLLMFLIYLFYGIYWNSDTSPLLGDGFHQYVIFDTALRNILHGTDSLFYTFNSGLGQNFYALSSYYLGSFLSPLTYFFDLKSMPDAVYLFTLVKFGLIGLSTFISIKGMFKKIPDCLILILSTSFALMSFSISQLEIKTWLDVFILAPLILLGLDRLIKKKGRILYFTTLSILFIQNYYFGYMMALFLIFWYLVQITWDFKMRIRTLPDFAVVSLLAGLTSLIMILPTYLDLSTHGETLTAINSIFTEDSWYLDVFAKNLIGSFDTTKYGSIPMIYTGLLPLLFAILFFTLRSIQFHVKLSYFILLALLVASFRLQYLDLLWQGMHAPNMFLHRYSWLFSLVLIFMAAESLNRLKELNWKHLLLSFALLITGFAAVFFTRSHYEFLKAENYILTIEFLLAYMLIVFPFVKSYISKKIFMLSLLFFAAFELALNSYYQVGGIAKEWAFAARSSYAQNLEEIDKLVTYTKTENNHFFRSEKLEPQTGNDSMKYNYNGISQFSSVRNTQASSALDKLGFKSAGTNLNLRYENNSILMDSIFGIKYNISQTDPDKFGFTPVKTEKEMTLYKNDAALGLAFLTNDIYRDVKFTNLTLDNQTEFLNQLTGFHYNYYKRLTAVAENGGSRTIGKRITAEVDTKNNSSFASMTYLLTVPADSQVYVNVPGIDFSNDNQTDIDITVNDLTSRYPTNNVFPFFNVGYFSQEQTIAVRLTFPDNATVSFDEPEFFAVDTKQYLDVISKLKEQPVAVQTQANTVTADYDADRDSSLFFTIPYDKGWSASLNGKAVALKRAQNGFMKIDVKAGKGKIKLTFIPNGLKEGAAASIAGILLFFAYNWIRNKQFQKNKSSP